MTDTQQTLSIGSTIYVVIRKGVYRHELGGVYFTEQEAIHAIRELYKGEPDDYHKYEIQPVAVGIIPKFEEPSWEGDDMFDPIEMESKTIYRDSE